MDGSDNGNGLSRSRSRSRRRKISSVSARLQPDFDPRQTARNADQNPMDSDEELDPKTMEFSTLVEFLHPTFIQDYLQKILAFLNSGKSELCFPNIAPYKETFLVKIANDNQRLRCPVFNEQCLDLGRQILGVIDENKNVYRWIHMYESGKVAKNVLVYKKMFYNERKTTNYTTNLHQTEEFKAPGGTASACFSTLASHLKHLDLSTKKDFPNTKKDYPNTKDFPSTKKDLANTSKEFPSTKKDPACTKGQEKDPQIPTSLKITFLNSTLKFLKEENRLTLEYPQMSLEQAKYFDSVICQVNTQTSVGFGYESLYASLYKALEKLSEKYKFKTIISETLSHAVRMVLRKVPKGSPIDLRHTLKGYTTEQSQSFGSSTPTPSTEGRELTKAQKEFLTKQKVINALSENFIKTSLQRILEFMDDDKRASLDFGKLTLDESTFLQMVFTLARHQEYYRLFSEECVVLVKKISRVERYETQHRRLWKMSMQVGRLNRQTRLGTLVFEKQPAGGKKEQNSAQILQEALERSRESRSEQPVSKPSREESRERSVPDIAQRLLELSTRCDTSFSKPDHSTERSGFGFAKETHREDQREIHMSLSKDRRLDRSLSGSRRDRHRRRSKENRPAQKYSIAFQSAGEHVIDCTSVTDDSGHAVSGDVRPVRQFGRKKKLMDDLSTPVEIDKAKRMMRQMGWDGGPLGARGEGITEPIMPAIHLAPGAGFGHVKQTSRSTADFRVSLLRALIGFVSGPNAETAIQFGQPLTKREMRFVRPTVKALNGRKPLGLKSEEMDLVRRILEEMTCQPHLVLECDIVDGNREVRLRKTEGSVTLRPGRKRKKRSGLTTSIQNQPLLRTTNPNSQVITTEKLLNTELSVETSSEKAHRTLACKVTFLETINEFLQLPDEKKEYVCDFILNTKQRDYIHLVVTMINKRDMKYKFATDAENDVYFDIKRNINNCFMTVVFSGQKFVLNKRFYQKRFTNSALGTRPVSKDEKNTIIYENNSVRRLSEHKNKDGGQSGDKNDRRSDKNDNRSEKNDRPASRSEKKDDKNDRNNDDTSCDILDINDDSDFQTLSERDDILIITDTDLEDLDSDSSVSSDSKADTCDEYKDLDSDSDDLKEWDLSDDGPMLLDMLENNSPCAKDFSGDEDKEKNDSITPEKGSVEDANMSGSLNGSRFDTPEPGKNSTSSPFEEPRTPPRKNLAFSDRVSAIDAPYGSNTDVKEAVRKLKVTDKEQEKVNKGLSTPEATNHSSEAMDYDVCLTPPLADLNKDVTLLSQEVNDKMDISDLVNDQPVDAENENTVANHETETNTSDCLSTEIDTIDFDVDSNVRENVEEPELDGNSNNDNLHNTEEYVTPLASNEHLNVIEDLYDDLEPPAQNLEENETPNHVEDLYGDLDPPVNDYGKLETGQNSNENVSNTTELSKDSMPDLTQDSENYIATEKDRKKCHMLQNLDNSFEAKDSSQNSKSGSRTDTREENMTPIHEHEKIEILPNSEDNFVAKDSSQHSKSDLMQNLPVNDCAQSNTENYLGKRFDAVCTSQDCKTDLMNAASEEYLVTVNDHVKIDICKQEENVDANNSLKNSKSDSMLGAKAEHNVPVNDNEESYMVQHSDVPFDAEDCKTDCIRKDDDSILDVNQDPNEDNMTPESDYERLHKAESLQENSDEKDSSQDIKHHLVEYGSNDSPSVINDNEELVTVDDSKENLDTKVCSEDKKHDLTRDASEEYMTARNSTESLNDNKAIEPDNMIEVSTKLQDLNERTELEISSQYLIMQPQDHNENLNNSEEEKSVASPISPFEHGLIPSSVVVIDYKKAGDVNNPKIIYYENLEGYISELSIKKDVQTESDASQKASDTETKTLNADSDVLKLDNSCSKSAETRLEEVNNNLGTEDKGSLCIIKTETQDTEENVDSKPNNERGLNLDQNDANFFRCGSENLVLKRAISKDSIKVESSPSSSKRSRSDSESSDKISKKYKYEIPRRVNIVPVAPQEIDMETARTIQKHISDSIDESILLPLLECHGIQNGGLSYTCTNDQTLKWLSKVITDSCLDLRLADVEFSEEKSFTLKVKLNSFIQEETEKILSRLELFNTGLNTSVWQVLERCLGDSFIILVVKVDEASYQYICENNFSLFSGVTKALFSAIWD